MKKTILATLLSVASFGCCLADVTVTFYSAPTSTTSGTDDYIFRDATGKKITISVNVNKPGSTFTIQGKNPIVIVGGVGKCKFNDVVEPVEMTDKASYDIEIIKIPRGNNCTWTIRKR